MPDQGHGDHHEEERLSALLDDELPERDALEVTRHLRTCDHCMAELTEIRSARQALRGLPAIEPPPLVFQQAVAAAAFADGRARRTRRVAFAAAASASIMAGVVFAAGGDPDGSVVPPVEFYVVDHVSRAGSTGPMITPVHFGVDQP